MVCVECMQLDVRLRHNDKHAIMHWHMWQYMCWGSLNDTRLFCWHAVCLDVMVRVGSVLINMWGWHVNKHSIMHWHVWDSMLGSIADDAILHCRCVFFEPFVDCTCFTLFFRN